MLDAFTAPGRFLRGNLHCHSTNSDGDLTPEGVCRFYRSHGYDFVCLSDHFRKQYDFPISDTIAFRTDGFTTIPGAELHAPATWLGDPWHILAVGLPADFAPTSDSETGPELAERAGAAGAFIAVAHPEWYGITLEDALTIGSAHAVEVFNTINLVQSGRGEGGYLLDQLLSAGRRLGAIAVDDAHRYRDDALGGWVMVKAEDNSPEAILAALKNGTYYASQGPQIHHVERNGDALLVETSPVGAIRLIGRGSRREFISGTEITRARLPLEVFADGWARLIVTDDRGKRAFSNPMYL